MSTKLQYTSSIKDMPLMFSEMKRTSILLTQGKTGDEIVQLSLEQNIYQLGKEKRRRDVPLRMLKRLSNINESLLNVIASGREDEARLVAFLALMKADRLLFEYMCEVYMDRYNAGFDDVTDKDFLDFIEHTAQNSETVAIWSVSNLVNIRGKIKTSLCEAGLAKKKTDALLIQRPLASGGIVSLLDETDRAYAKAMLLEV